MDKTRTTTIAYTSMMVVRDMRQTWSWPSTLCSPFALADLAGSPVSCMRQKLACSLPVRPLFCQPRYPDRNRRDPGEAIQSSIISRQKRVHSILQSGPGPMSSRDWPIPSSSWPWLMFSPSSNMTWPATAVTPTSA